MEQRKAENVLISSWNIFLVRGYNNPQGGTLTNII